MTLQEREQKALEAYLKLMQGRGADARNLAQRRALLEMLFPALAGQPAEGWLYRDAVDECLPQINRSDWPFFLLLTREYFHFWADDFKAIAAALNDSGSFEVEPPAPAYTDESFKQLWKRLDTEKFSVVELWPLNAYMAALREEGLDQSVVDTRQKLVRLLLVQLREIEEKDGKNYRHAVDAMLPLFVMKETRHLFLAVVRQFYHFWIGAPDAASRITAEQPGSR
jgi:hypothetical protein